MCLSTGISGTGLFCGHGAGLQSSWKGLRACGADRCCWLRPLATSCSLLAACRSRQLLCRSYRMLLQPHRWLPPNAAGRVQVPHQCLLDMGTDESANKGMLATALAILSEVHKSVFAAPAPGQVRRQCVLHAYTGS